MTWFKVDDTLAFHHKVVAAGNAAMGLWVRAGSLSAQQLTDGVIPDHMIPALGTTGQARRLVDVGLWTRVEGGYRFHEWDERQPSRDEVKSMRSKKSDAGAVGNHRRWHVGRGVKEAGCPFCEE